MQHPRLVWELRLGRIPSHSPLEDVSVVAISLDVTRWLRIFGKFEKSSLILCHKKAGKKNLGYPGLTAEQAPNPVVTEMIRRLCGAHGSVSSFIQADFLLRQFLSAMDLGWLVKLVDHGFL